MGAKSRSSRVVRLQRVGADIDDCRICEPIIDSPLQKPVGLYRGEPAPIVIVGQSPGRQEEKRKRAFAGQSGRRLDEWLAECGAPPRAPRRKMYLTSILKCTCAKHSHFRKMASRCLPFLRRQLEIIQPRLVITLGADAHGYFRMDKKERFRDVACQLRRTQDYLLMPLYGFHHHLMVWPHPSGLSRWLNNDAHRDRLRSSFRELRPLVTELIAE